MSPKESLEKVALHGMDANPKSCPKFFAIMKELGQTNATDESQNGKLLEVMRLLRCCEGCSIADRCREEMGRLLN